MSQAEELLNGMSEEVPVHSHPVPDTDTYFVIDPITRKIENANRKKNVVMQYDHNSERFTFELPRYIDGHDMLECTSVTVNVDNIEVVESDGIEEVESRVNSDAPDMTDLRLHPDDPEKVICSWLISRNSTQLAGILSFHIEFKCVESNGDVVYEWSTDEYDEIKVKTRKKNGEAALTPHSDVLEQWRTRIFGAGDSVMANIVAEGEAQVAAVKAESETQQEAVELKGAQTLESIPEDYTEVDAMADEAVRTKGDAIVCEAAGKSIAIKDSSDDHIRGLNLFGKTTQVVTKGYQLFDASKFPTITRNGVTVTNNGDGSFKIQGDTVVNSYFGVFKDYNHDETATLLKAGKLTLITETPSSPYVYITLRKNNADVLSVSNRNNASEYTTILDEYLTDEAYTIRVGFFASLDAAVTDGVTIRPVLYQNGDGAYESYTGGKPSPSPDYPQELVSVGDGGNICIGITTNNLFDKDTNIFTDATTIDKVTGEIVTTSGNGWRTFENLLMVQPNTDYVISGSVVPSAWTCTVAFYDVNKNYLTFVNVQNNGGKNLLKFTTPDKAVYLRFTAHANSLDANTIVVNAGTSAIEYRTGHTQMMSITHVIPGIPVTSGGNYTDSDGQQWICDEVDLERGVYVQRVAIEELSKVSAFNDYGLYCTLFKGRSKYDVKFLCTHANSDISFANGQTGAYMSCVIYKKILPASVIDVQTGQAWIDDLKAAGTPFTVAYVLTTPIETPLTADEIAAFKELRTNYPNTTILNDAGAWMSVKYNADTKTYVENPKTLKLVDSSTGVVYELKIVDGSLTVVPVQ